MVLCYFLELLSSWCCILVFSSGSLIDLWNFFCLNLNWCLFPKTLLLWWSQSFFLHSPSDCACIPDVKPGGLVNIFSVLYYLTFYFLLWHHLVLHHCLLFLLKVNFLLSCLIALNTLLLMFLQLMSLVLLLNLHGTPFSPKESLKQFWNTSNQVERINKDEFLFLLCVRLLCWRWLNGKHM